MKFCFIQLGMNVKNADSPFCGASGPTVLQPRHPLLIGGRRRGNDTGVWRGNRAAAGAGRRTKLGSSVASVCSSREGPDALDAGGPAGLFLLVLECLCVCLFGESSICARRTEGCRLLQFGSCASCQTSSSPDAELCWEQRPGPAEPLVM